MQHHQLRNITVIVDHNGLQAMDKVDNVLSQNLFNRFVGWGFQPEVVDGHHYTELLDSLKYRPRILIALTTKGKGYPWMENIAKWHYRVPDDNQR